MKEVKIVCNLDYHCDLPFDSKKEVPLDVCLRCGELKVVKAQDELDKSDSKSIIKKLDELTVKVAECVFELLNKELSEDEQEEFKTCLRKLEALVKSSSERDQL